MRIVGPPLRGSLLTALPPGLQARDVEVPSKRRWRVETAVLALIGLVLAIVAINDIFWSVQDAGVLVADQHTWRHHTGRDYYNVSVGPLVFGQPIDVACADATPGPPGERTQICLIMDGAAVDGLRHVIGGWKLPPRLGDFPKYRYDCFGAGETKARCPHG
ncbi:MAG: hypothetical protein ABSC56_07275 [Solirubrobacteraceae bacterium]|jgi:hypothetical protein